LLLSFDQIDRKLICSMVDPVVSMMERLHCLIIGPGLGRCPMVLEATARIIQQARNRNLPLVIDADGLYLLTLDAYCDVLAGYDKVVLTPNAMEAKRLVGLEHCWQGAVIVQKGQVDLIKSNGGSEHAMMIVDDSKVLVQSLVLTCQEEGGLKRSGGIGDILAGCIGTLVAWNRILQEQEARNSSSSSSSSSSKGTAILTGGGGGRSSVSNASVATNMTTTTTAHLSLACWTACCFVKRATKRAFETHHRAMTAPDILNELGPTIHDMTSMGEEEVVESIIITSVLSTE
jgi:ATP-dependent NAD(P)H-hydrate dehydratase